MADFDRSVTRIVAQPFVLRARIQGKVRRHIPDYWLHTSDGSVVVDVKPAKRLSDPVVQATFEWTRDLVESIGWRFEIASEQPEVMLENVRFLSGYRRADRISQTCLAALRALSVDGMEFRDIRQSVPSSEATRPRSVAAHAVDPRTICRTCPKCCGRRPCSGDKRWRNAEPQHR